MMKSPLFAKTIMFILILSLFACSLASCQQKVREISTIRVGHAPHDHHSPLYIAAMNPDLFKGTEGLFLKEITFRKEYDLISGERTVAHVLIDSSTGGNELIRKLAEGHFDIAFGGVPAILKFIDNGYPLQIIAPAMAEGAGLVMRTDVPFEDWNGFVRYVKGTQKPLRIGYKIAVSVQNLIFEQALQEEGIPYSSSIEERSAKVQIVNLHGAKNLIPALENSLIDGFVINQPFLAKAEHKKVGKAIAMLSDLPPHGKWKGNPCCALAANNSFVQNNREASEAFLTLILRANRHINKNPVSSAEQIARWLNISADVEKRSIPTIKFTTEFDDKWNSGVDFWISSMISAKLLNGSVRDAYEKKNHFDLIYNSELYQRAKERS